MEEGHFGGDAPRAELQAVARRALRILLGNQRAGPLALRDLRQRVLYDGGRVNVSRCVYGAAVNRRSRNALTTRRRVLGRRG